MNWTDDRVELLKRLWAEGLSASQIALQLGEASRNAVIGKVHRLGLAGRAKAVVPAAPRQRKPRAPGPVVRMARPGGVVRGNTALAAVPVYEEEEVAPAAAPRVAAENVVPIGQRCNILELGIGRCRWPVGDPGASDFFFCGGKTAGVSPYCGYHARIAYHPQADRRRERRAAESAAAHRPPVA